MERLKFQITAVIILIIGLTDLSAQQALIGSGGDAVGAGGSVSYSVGQPVYTTATGTNGSVAQGVQQPYEISVAIGVEEADDIILEYRVYPNPTSGKLVLSVKNYKSEELSYRIFDFSGKLLQDRRLQGSTVTIELDNLARAVYFLKIIDHQQEVKTFKIIKN